MTGAQYPIQVVARRTGLSAHVLRIWEQRYRAVEPERTPTNRRFYSEADIERLGLLRDLTRSGHSIGQVARLPTSHLRRLDGAKPRGPAGAASLRSRGPATDGLVGECLAAIRALDARALEDGLQRGATELGALGVLQRLVAPLVQALGDAWRQGGMTTAHEHFATAAIRVFLGNAARAFGSLAEAPALVVATPAGQVHEMGALLVGAVAANLGWQVVYLGASLPAAEIAGAARQCRARAVALSLVYPQDDPRLEGEMTRLRAALPPETALLVGGRALPAFRGFLANLGALPVNDLLHLGVILDGLRQVRRAGRATKAVAPSRSRP